MNSPQLFQSLELTLGAAHMLIDPLSHSAKAACLARGRALLHWLLRHSPAGLEQLQLSLAVPYNASEAEQAELYGLADGCLVACGPHLQKLAFIVQGLRGSQPVYEVRPWFVHMRQLHTLSLHSHFVPLRLLASMGSLSGLRSLSIHAGHLTVGAAVALPPTLTHLDLEAKYVDGEFSQVGGSAAADWVGLET